MISQKRNRIVFCALDVIMLDSVLNLLKLKIGKRLSKINLKLYHVKCVFMLFIKELVISILYVQTDTVGIKIPT